MNAGCVVEFIDQQRILSAVILEVKNSRLHLLTENDRELNMAAARLSHISDHRIDPGTGRHHTVEMLKGIARRRESLTADINIKELWEVMNEDCDWVDLKTMTGICFPHNSDADHEAAVVRAFFKNRDYFKFHPHRFKPYTPTQVEWRLAREREAARQERIIADGSAWIRRVLATVPKAAPAALTPEEQTYAHILRSCFLFGKDSPHIKTGKVMAARAGLQGSADLFRALVRAGVFSEDENIELHRLEIPVSFPSEVTAAVDHLLGHSEALAANPNRKDLTMVPLMTIDGQATLDFDDAISIEDKGDHYRLGVHIADVGHFIKRDDPIDREASARASSIYMPDQRISMLPPQLAEGLCSLKAGEFRPAISILMRLSPTYSVIDFELIPSWIRVMQQFSYYDVNQMADHNRDIVLLREIAQRFRQWRIGEGAVQINLPDVNVWFGPDDALNVNQINRESPGRMLVSEIMIMANWVMARFLSAHSVPAIFRTQAEPRERLFKGEEGTLFQNWMQRRQLNRFILGPTPDRHCGLGLDVYVTATSPIRKYGDLVTQRQVRAALGLEAPYGEEDIKVIIQALASPMRNVTQLQRSRLRYWILKHLASKVGEKEEALVLAKRRNGYQILLTAYLVECDLTVSNGVRLNPEDLIRVTIQQVDPHHDQLVVFLG